jgi:hypothetical protein
MSSVSLSQHLAVSVDPELPPSLISPVHLRALHALASRLPAGICEFFGFESRLGDVRAEVDFLLCAKASEGGRDVLAGLIPGQALPPEFLDHPVWQQIRRFATAWVQPASPMHDCIQNVWLEFDISGDMGIALCESSTTPPVPSLFIGTDALFGHYGCDAPPWLLKQALPLCMGQSVSQDLAVSLHAAIGALPAHANIFQIGMMLSRPGGANMLRLCIRGMKQHEAVRYLQDVQWPGDPEAIQDLLNFVYASSNSVDLDIDLQPKVGPKIGLECSFGADRDTPTRLAAFLERLVQQGLCLDTKRHALLAWSRGFHERTNPSAWPADLRARSANASTPTASMFMRWVYHVKIVHVPGQPLEAKAYLAVRQAWITPEFIRQTQKTAAHPSAT